MATIIHGTLPYAVYDVPLLFVGEKYWANAQLTLSYEVTRDPSSGGDFCDWDIYSYDTVKLYTDDGEPEDLPAGTLEYVKRKVMEQLDDKTGDIVHRCIEDALDFT